MGQFYDEEKIKAMEAAAAAASPATPPAAAPAEKPGAGTPPAQFYDENKIKAMEGAAAPQPPLKGLTQVVLIALAIIAGLGLLWWKLTHDPDTMIVNVNKASATELSYLPGVGPVTAQKIIDGRPYQTVEDLRKVPGIGQKTYEKMKARVKVE